MTWQAYPFPIVCVCVCVCVYMSLHASFVQAFSLVALVPAFSDCCVLSTHKHQHRHTYTPLSLQSKLGIHSLPCEGEIGSIERLGGLPVQFKCVCLCVSLVLRCVCLMGLYVFDFEQLRVFVFTSGMGDQSRYFSSTAALFLKAL